MRVVVAGGRGFIGAAVCRALAGAGHEAVPIGRGEHASGDALVWAAGGKLADLDANRAVHAGAAVAAVRATGAARVVYLSSGECYGAAPLPWREDGPALGTTAYARAKLEGEAAVAALRPAAVLRLGVVYGPGQRPGMLLPSICAALRAGRRIALTSGEQTRDFVAVADVAAAIVAALDGPPGVLNVASGREVRVRDVCEELGRRLGAPALLGFGELARRSDDPARYVLDVRRAADVLGWRPVIALEEGLAQLADAG